MNTYYVYIMTNHAKGTLYTGVSKSLSKRIWEHKNNRHKDSFTSRYNLKRLVYYEKFENVSNAIKREKQIKAGSRSSKIRLIESKNTEWADLSKRIL